MTTPPVYRLGIVKQVLSGDTIVIRRKCPQEPPSSPPPEKVVIINGIVAPKLARQKPMSDTENKDEPFAWEAREFLRTLLVGKEVIFLTDKLPNSQTDKEYGKVWAGPNPEKNVNVAVALLAEGLAKLRDNSRNHPLNKDLAQVEEDAKNHGKGVWSADQTKVRDVKWIVPDPIQFVNKHNTKPLKAIVEYVRDGSTVRLCILPDFYNVMVMMAGIRCPAIRQDTSEPFAEEARYYVEARLLQRDVEVQLVSVSNNNFVGTIIHPTADIAECLVKNGLAKCVDWSMGVMKPGAAAQLKKAEKAAKAAKINIWQDYRSNVVEIPEKDKEFHALVIEVINGDSMVVKLNNGTKKICLSSIRTPRSKPLTEEEEQNRPKPYRPLYDTPWLLEAREFLRKKLVGKKAHIIVDYIQPQKDNIPEKINCTVLCGGGNVAEGLVSKGLASVFRHRNDDDQRSSRYDKLLEAEQAAIKAAVGIHAKKDIPTHRIQDTSRNAANAKKFFPFLKRLQKTEAVVEYVASGSKMKLYIPKESVLVNFLLAGIVCPRNSRTAVNGNPPAQEGHPFGDEALRFTKDACLQRDVTVTIEDMDKVGNFIGWLFIDNVNMSVALVENGLASLLSTSTSSEYAKKLKDSEDQAQKLQKGIWKNYVEKEVAPKEVYTVAERRLSYENVKITTITTEGTFYVQNIDAASQLRALMLSIAQEFQQNPPLPGAYWPNRGKICAARFSGDGQWYRAKIEKVNDNTVLVYYLDYGNREELNHTQLAELPSIFLTDPPYAAECVLACVKFAKDNDDKIYALQSLAQDSLGKNLLLNVEIKGSPTAVTLIDPANKQDIGKNLISEGWVLVNDPRDRRLASLVAEYCAAQEKAVKSRLNIWRHGDIREDDASEFGVSR